jgi:hypothetical protein
MPLIIMGFSYLTGFADNASPDVEAARSSHSILRHR